jgi:DNA-binding transcriptional LysR family regulator
MNDMSTLDVDAVRTFVAIADLKSFTRAAEALGSTQGAISVKLKRLENRLGKKLIERTPRLVRLSAEGAAFLEPARDFLAAHDRAIAGLTPARRRFSLGIATHVGGPEVPTLLSRLNAHDPALTIEVRLNDSRELLDAFDDGKIDAAIILREDDRRDGEVLAPEHFGWFATPGFVHRAGEPLRLAASSPACGILNVARRALDGGHSVDGGFPWLRCLRRCRCGLGGPCRFGVLSPAHTARHGRGQPAVRPAGNPTFRNRVAFNAFRSKIARHPEDAAAAFREHRPSALAASVA